MNTTKPNLAKGFICEKAGRRGQGKKSPWQWLVRLLRGPPEKLVVNWTNYFYHQCQHHHHHYRLHISLKSKGTPTLIKWPDTLWWRSLPTSSICLGKWASPWGDQSADFSGWGWGGGETLDKLDVKLVKYHWGHWDWTLDKLVHLSDRKIHIMVLSRVTVLEVYWSFTCATFS